MGSFAGALGAARVANVPNLTGRAILLLK